MTKAEIRGAWKALGGWIDETGDLIGTDEPLSDEWVIIFDIVGVGVMRNMCAVYTSALAQEGKHVCEAMPIKDVTQDLLEELSEIYGVHAESE